MRAATIGEVLLGAEKAAFVLPTQYRGSLADHLDLVADAERLGFATAWVTEVAGADAMALAGAAAARTTRIRIGTGVIPTFTRTAPLIAMGAATVQAVSHGRFVLGLGSSTAQIVEGWHGLPFERPLERMAETIALVRTLLAWERSSFNGAEVRSTGFTIGADPVPAPPVHLAALGERSLRLAGTAADGAILTLTTPEGVARAQATVAEAAAAAGRDPAAVEIVCYVRVLVTDNVSAGAESVRRELWWYSASPVYRRHFAAQGFEQEMGAAAAAWARNDRGAAFDSITSEMARTFALIGSTEHVRAELARYWDAGADEVALYFVGAEGGVPFLASQLASVAASSRRNV